MGGWKLTGLLTLHMLWQARDPVSNQEEDRYTLTSITVSLIQTDEQTPFSTHIHTYIHKNENNLSFFFYCAIYSLFFLPPIAPMPTPYQDSFVSPKLNSPIKIILLETVSETHSQILDQA